MKKTSATANLISTILICISLLGISMLGIFTLKILYIVPFIFSGIYFVSYLFWKTHNVNFPYYFHITLLFLLMNNGLAAKLNYKKLMIAFMFIILLFSYISLHNSRKKQLEFEAISDAIKEICNRWKNMLRKNPGIVFHTGIHAVILLILGYVSAFVYEYRGYWLMVSGLAVLIGDEYGKIITRGLKRILGAFIGFFVGILLVSTNANGAILIIIFLLTYVGIFSLMPFKYILGSACIGLQAVLGNAMMQKCFGYEIFVQRMFWTILGTVLTFILCFMMDKLFENLYTSYTREPMIYRKNAWF